MIDFHIHVTPFDTGGAQGGLLPTEALRLARCAGFRAVGLIVRADASSLSFLFPALLLLVRNCSLYAGVEAFAGVELVHVPPALLPDAVAEARSMGAKLVLAHGETIVRNPATTVETGTNLAAIAAGVDILAHPGLITPQDAAFAAEKGVRLELSLAPWHCLANAHIVRAATLANAPLLLNSDARTPADFYPPDATRTLRQSAALGATADPAALAAEARKLAQSLLR
ncbi:MAG: histidinol phosphate phosphatase domain-containing protein [Bilophila sp.]